jgi:hypothetical protein
LGRPLPALPRGPPQWPGIRIAPGHPTAARVQGAGSTFQVVCVALCSAAAAAVVVAATVAVAAAVAEAVTLHSRAAWCGQQGRSRLTHKAPMAGVITRGDQWSPHLTVTSVPLSKLLQRAARGPSIPLYVSWVDALLTRWRGPHPTSLLLMQGN